MIFLDTGYFKALYDEKDPHHNASLKIKDYINEHKETTVINTTVMVETLNRAKGPHDIVEKIYDDLHVELPRLCRSRGFLDLFFCATCLFGVF